MDEVPPTWNWSWSRRNTCWLAGILAVSLVPSVTAGMNGLVLSATLFSLLSGLTLSVPFCRELIRFFIEPTPPAPSGGARPPGLDSYLPLNGRWLRMLLWSPAVLCVWACIWMAISICVFLVLWACGTGVRALFSLMLKW